MVVVVEVVGEDAATAVSPDEAGSRARSRDDLAEVGRDGSRVARPLATTRRGRQRPGARPPIAFQAGRGRRTAGDQGR